MLVPDAGVSGYSVTGPCSIVQLPPDVQPGRGAPDQEDVQPFRIESGVGSADIHVGPCVLQVTLRQLVDLPRVAHVRNRNRGRKWKRGQGDVRGGSEAGEEEEE